MNILSNALKKWLLSSVQRLGFHVVPMRKYRPVDLRQHTGNPLRFSYRYPGRSLLVEAPIEYGVGFLSYPATPTRALRPVIREAFDRPGSERAVLREGLRRFYAEWQPANAAAYFQLDVAADSALRDLPPWLASWPWDHHDIEALKAVREAIEKRDNALVNRGGVDIQSGWKFCGPVSDAKLDIEVERLLGVVESIRAHGFRRRGMADGDIRAAVLHHPDGRWRWCVYSGHHRYAVWRALDHRSVPVRIFHFIRRDEVAMWPGVVSGLFDAASALKVFDDCFLPAACEMPVERQRCLSRVK
jgi:hypothetical protein